MADKEPRKRKKKKEGQKREENEEVPLPKEKHNSDRSSEEADNHDFGHEPSIFAKSVFFILFSLLIVAVGVIFFTLHGVHRGPWEESKDTLAPVLPPDVLHPELPLTTETLDEDLPVESMLHPESIHEDRVDPTVYQPDVIEDDQVSIDPSEIHPWAEHVPQETALETNIFSQIYDALGEELFQDDNNESEEEDQQDEADGFLDDLIEDAFFREGMESVDEEVKSKPEEAAITDSFEVIVEDVEFPSLQKLVELDESLSAESHRASENAEDRSDQVNIQLSAVEPPLGFQESITNLYTDIQDAEKCTSEEFCESPDDHKLDQNHPPIAQQLGEEEHQRSDHLTDDSSREPPNTEPPDVASLADFLQDDLSTTEQLPHREGLSQSSDDQPEVLAVEKVPEEDNMIEWPENGVILEKSAKQSADEEKKDSQDRENLPESEEVPMQSELLEKELIDSEPPKDEGEESQQAEDFEMPYENAEITNEYDFLFKEEIDEADRIVEKEPDESDFYFWRF